MRTIACAVAGFCSLVVGAAAQPDTTPKSFGRSYAFPERAPRSLLEQRVAGCLPAVVKVHGASGLSTIRPYASGVVVSDRGHILTLDLVMVQTGQTRVVLADGSVHDAQVLPPDDELGVRMLKIDPGDRQLTVLAPTQRTDWSNGALVVSVGNSFRLAEFSEKLSVTFGVLSARMRSGLRYRLADVDYAGELLVTDATNNPGHYGGALVSLGTGEWLGINARLLESKETNTQVSAAIPAWQLQAYIDRYTKPGGLAAAVAAAEAEAAAEPEQIPVYHGIRLFEESVRRSPPAYVERVRRGSPGRAAGLRPDDLIVRIDEHPVRTCAEFARVVRRYRPGDEVVVTYKRGRRILRGAMTLAEEK